MRVGMRTVIAALGVAALALASPGAFEAYGQSGPGLAGQLLVATERMPDPRFVRTVIYMLFDEDHERKWERAMARRRIDL